VPNAPFGIGVLPDGRIVVSCLGDSFAVLPAIGGSYTVRAAGTTPTDVAFSTDGRFAYLTQQGDQAIGKVTLATPAVTGTFAVPFSPFRIRRSRSGTKLFVTGAADSVVMLDIATGARLAAYAMEVAQNGLAESLDGSKLYVGSQDAGVVREITIATGTAGRTFVTGAFTQEVVLSADGSLMFVARESSPYLSVWNLATGTTVDSILLGRATFGMALSPDGKRLYATAPGAGKVFIVDAIARTVLDSLDVGGTPRRVAFNSSGNRAVVANEAGWVDFIN
jgi:YVTN family beta-propeller protein